MPSSAEHLGFFELLIDLAGADTTLKQSPDYVGSLGSQRRRCRLSREQVADASPRIFRVSMPPLRQPEVDESVERFLIDPAVFFERFDELEHRLHQRLTSLIGLMFGVVLYFISLSGQFAD